MTLFLPQRNLMLTLLLSLLLTACSSLTRYSVSEQDINDYLATQVGFERQLSLPGLLSAKVRFNDLTSHIGRSQPDKVDLDAAGHLTLQTPIGQQALTLRLALRARPDYQPEQGAIYLRDLEVLSVSTEPANIGSALTPLLPMLSLSLSQFLEQTPVYRLDSHRSKQEALARDKVTGLRVEPGALVIPFSVL